MYLTLALVGVVVLLYLSSLVHKRCSTAVDWHIMLEIFTMHTVCNISN